MIRIEQEVLIERTPAEVYAFMADVGNLTRWQSGAIQAELISDPPLREGSRFSEVVRVGPWKVRTQCQVTDLQPAAVFAFEAMSKPIDYAGSFRFRAEADGTRLSLRAVVQLKGFWRLVGPLLAGDLKKEAKAELETIRRILQTDPVAQPR